MALRFAATNRILLVVAMDFDSLPDNPDLLRQMVIDLATQLEVHERRYQRVQHILEQLLVWRFVQKREKIDERQLFLFALQLEATGGDVKELITELEQDAADKEAQAAKDAESTNNSGDDGDNDSPFTGGGSGTAQESSEPKRKGHGRRRLQRALLRERILHELSEAERACPDCTRTMERIGEDSSERLEYVPATLKIIEDVRVKYACRCCSHLKTAPKPAQPIAKGLAGASLLAQVAVLDRKLRRTRKGRIWPYVAKTPPSTTTPPAGSAKVPSSS